MHFAYYLFKIKQHLIFFFRASPINNEVSVYFIMYRIGPKLQIKCSLRFTYAVYKMHLILSYSSLSAHRSLDSSPA